MDYRRMVLAIGGRDGRDKNGLVSLLRDYLDRQDSVTSNPNTQSLGPTSGTPPCDEREGGVAQQRLAASTMEGAHGTLMTGCKREQVKQFDALLEYCRSEGVVLNRELVERGMCAHTHKHTHVHVHTHVHAHTYTYAHAYTFAHTHVHRHAHT